MPVLWFLSSDQNHRKLQLHSYSAAPSTAKAICIPAELQQDPVDLDLVDLEDPLDSAIFGRLACCRKGIWNPQVKTLEA
jgi:hypothetical protein